MAAPARDLPLRIVVEGPPPDATFAMQCKDHSLLPPLRHDRARIVFELSVRVSEGKEGEPTVLGPFAHGGPADRFLYLNSGTLAGDAGSCYTRRAKIKTAAISWELVDETLATPGGILEAVVAGRAKDGGPCCASIPLARGWRVASDRK